MRLQYLQSPEDRLAAVERIAAMALPTPSWSELKQDLEEAYGAGVP